ncbi:MAG: DUF3626 domain-containing protein [Ilumatobacteraceae bacterium]
MVGSVTLHFHPERGAQGSTVIDRLVVDGCYRSQFETGTSNGGLTAFPGGDRWRWESRLFDRRYDDAPGASRPVYGSWNRRGDAHGGSPRFGSAYLRLREDVVERSTFCFPDSVFEPALFGGPGRLPELCAAADAAGLDALDDYVEVQVHGGVSMQRDVEAVVLDPCFRGTPVAAAAQHLPCDVEYHPGYVARTADLDESFRTPEAVQLAGALGVVITPTDVGAAANAGVHDAQVLKHVWHLLARFGRL